jgi:hypothetical protein
MIWDCITDPNRIQLVLFGMQNRTFGPCLASLHRILNPYSSNCFYSYAVPSSRAFSFSRMRCMGLPECAGRLLQWGATHTSRYPLLTIVSCLTICLSERPFVFAFPFNCVSLLSLHVVGLFKNASQTIGVIFQVIYAGVWWPHFGAGLKEGPNVLFCLPNRTKRPILEGCGGCTLVRVPNKDQMSCSACQLGPSVLFWRCVVAAVWCGSQIRTKCPILLAK